MSSAIFKGETSMKDLVTRLFQLPDKTAKTTQQAADALLHANPQLKDLSKVPAGTVINVPSTAPPLNPSEEVPAIVSRQMAITRQAQQTLDSLNQRLADIDARATDGANAFLALTQSKQFKALAQNSPDLKTQMPALVASAKSMVKGVKAQPDARNQAVANLQTSLQALTQMKS